ncbi:MAG: HTTM domain-containing protein [Flavobacteriales bacterium]|nr:HTTM domain-containing protein [Flavobacteriales bacterium]
MSIPANTVLLFQRALHLWVSLHLLTALPAMEELWLDPLSPPHPMGGPRYTLVHAFGSWLPVRAAPVVLACTLLVALWGVVRPLRWWLSLPLWAGYSSLMNLAFMASSGGQQLMANLLFWNVLLCLERSGHATWVGATGFWIIRLQLLLAYAATGLHKLTGTHWLDGTAMGIVAGDPAFGPAWLTGFPLLAKSMTWAVLVFQLTFPVAVWWRRTRLPWMAFGAVFHLGTALWLGIPEMGAAFIAAYAIWLSNNESGAVLRCYRWRQAVSVPAT